MSKKSVLLILVEGPSDETTLAEPLSRILDKNTIRIKVQHGDILTEFKNGVREFKVNRENVKGELLKIFKTKISDIKRQYKIKHSDYIGLIYCTDIDNCFTSEEFHAKNKKECLEVLFNIDKLKLDKRSSGINFNVVFFSKDLEHVFHNINKNVSDEEKEALSREFIKSCNGQNELYWLTKFENIFKDENVETWDNFEESYNGIKEASADNRATNLNCFIELYNKRD